MSIDTKSPHLLKVVPSLYASDLRGMAYVKDSNGNTDNVRLAVGVRIDTSDNTAMVSYRVTVFEGRADAFCKSFDNYAEAVAIYNELAIKFNAYR